ncbi:MAG: LppX_LprAFG lipoprotein [Pseudonocardiaceae bacterium]
MSHRRYPVLALLAALLAVLMPGCSGGEELPDGAQLLSRSAESMRGISSARFDLDIEGTGSGLPIRGAQGRLTREGDADGTATLDQGQQVSELRFVLTGDTLYLQGPTGGFQRVPAGFASSVYDPSVILDAQRGVPALLANGTQPVTEAREAVGGTDAYRVTATFPRSVLSGLVPGLVEDAKGQVWIGAAQPHLLQARFPLAGGTVTVRLSEFDAPVDITPPS